MKRTVIIGGGTFSHVRNHLSLAAPAFGTTAKILADMFTDATEHKNEEQVILQLTKMADSRSDIVTTEDLSKYVDCLIADPNVGTIIMNAAVVDFDGLVLEESDDVDGLWHSEIEEGSHAERLRTSDGFANLELRPSDKIISRIRRARPDIFLVGFKTTTGKSEEEQFEIALKMMKSSKCNLVLANDVVTRNNMIITPEESKYCITADRAEVLEMLTDMTIKRHRLTYHRTELDTNHKFPLSVTPSTFQLVMQYLLDNGGYIENNGNGFTPGHFCYLDRSINRMYSSQRKMNHNDVHINGLTGIEFSNENAKQYRVIAQGQAKPSVGATSQMLLLDEYKQFDCIIHTHNPLKEGSELPIQEQYAYQCGSLECGLNTLAGIKIFEYKGIEIGAVYLNKHGANILFKSSDNSDIINEFINENLELGVKVS
jgi:hypothetical protein